MLALIFVFQLDVARLPVASLLHHAVKDDAFYYLEVAFRAAQGQGWTFDGLHATNGFEPVWGFLLTGVALVTPAKLDLLHRSLVLAAILNLGAGLGLWLTARRTLSPGLGPVLLAMWVSIQLIPVISLNAMEISLNCFAFSWLLFFLAGLKSTPSPPKAARPFLTLVAASVFLAVFFLIRVDNVIYCAAAAVVVAARVAPGDSWRSWPSLRRQALFVMAMAGLASMMVSPYLLWNRLAHGGWLPVSAAIKQLFNFERVVEPLGGYFSPAMFAHALSRLLAKILWVVAQTLAVFGLGEPLYLPRPAYIIAASVTLGAALMSGMAARRLRTRHGESATEVLAQGTALRQWGTKSAAVTIVFWLGFVLLNESLRRLSVPATPAKFVYMAAMVLCAFLVGLQPGSAAAPGSASRTLLSMLALFSAALVVHGLTLIYAADYFLDYTSWYFANWYILAALWLTIAFGHAWRALLPKAVGPAWQAGLAAAVAILVLLGVASARHRILDTPLTPAQNNNGLYVSAVWLKDHTPPGVRVAAYSAGIIGYFSERVTINLDGLINNLELLPYRFGPKTMTEYLDLVCADYVADYLAGVNADAQLPSGDFLLHRQRGRLEVVQTFADLSGTGTSARFVIFRVIRSTGCRQPSSIQRGSASCTAVSPGTCNQGFGEMTIRSAFDERASPSVAPHQESVEFAMIR